MGGFSDLIAIIVLAVILLLVIEGSHRRRWRSGWYGPTYVYRPFYIFRPRTPGLRSRPRRGLRPWSGRGCASRSQVRRKPPSRRAIRRFPARRRRPSQSRPQAGRRPARRPLRRRTAHGRAPARRLLWRGPFLWGRRTARRLLWGWTLLRRGRAARRRLLRRGPRRWAALTPLCPLVSLYARRRASARLLFCALRRGSPPPAPAHHGCALRSLFYPKFDPCS